MRPSTSLFRSFSALDPKQAGFGLTETLLVLGAASVMSLAVYGVFFASDVTAEVKTEQQNLNQLSTAVERSFGLTGGFSGLSLSEVQAENLLPATYRRSGTVQTEWGSTVALRPNNVARANDSFVIDYGNVPAKACSKLAAAMAPNVYQILIGGTNVMTNTGLDAGGAAAACAAGARMEFVYYSGLSSGSAVATPGLTLPSAPPPVVPATPTTPVGPVGGAPSVDDATPGTPGVVAPGDPVTPPPVAPPIAPPAPVVTNPPSPIPGGVTPPPPLNRCSAGPGTTEARNQACPAGQYGAFQEQRSVSYSCPEAWAAPVATWTPWTGVGGCQNCPGDENRPLEEWRSGTRACPSGLQGTETFEYLARVDRTFRYNCPAGTTALPGAVEVWNSGWYSTGSERNVNRSGCSSPGMVVNSGFVNLSVANAYGTVGRLTLRETTSWTYLAGQSSEWSSNWGPVRGNGSIEITYNGATATVAGGGNSSNTAVPGSPANFTASNQTINFNGKLVEFEFRGASSASNGWTIQGSVAFYYRMK